MVTNWSLELSQHRSVSLLSRLLLYTFPSELYVIGGGVNKSLAALNAAIANRFNKLAKDGIVTSWSSLSFKASSASFSFCFLILHLGV